MIAALSLSLSLSQGITASKILKGRHVHCTTKDYEIVLKTRAWPLKENMISRERGAWFTEETFHFGSESTTGTWDTLGWRVITQGMGCLFNLCRWNCDQGTRGLLEASSGFKWCDDRQWHLIKRSRVILDMLHQRDIIWEEMQDKCLTIKVLRHRERERDKELRVYMITKIMIFWVINDESIARRDFEKRSGIILIMRNILVSESSHYSPTDQG
jgi:hypothetical protein